MGGEKSEYEKVHNIFNNYLRGGADIKCVGVGYGMFRPGLFNRGYNNAVGTCFELQNKNSQLLGRHHE